MNDAALLIAAALALLFTGYLLGTRDEHNDPEGTVAQRRRAVRAEERATALEAQVGNLNQLVLDLSTDNVAHHTGQPRRVRANRHGGFTVVTGPARIAEIVHFPTTPSPVKGAQA